MLNKEKIKQAQMYLSGKPVCGDTICDECIFRYINCINRDFCREIATKYIRKAKLKRITK